MMRHVMLCGDRTRNDLPQSLTVDFTNRQENRNSKEKGGGGGGGRKNLVSF